MGNPIRIEKDNGSYVLLDWEGRQLVEYKVHDIDNKVLQTVTYKYNDQGIRTYKKVETNSSNYTEYSYYLEGDKVLAEQIKYYVGGNLNKTDNIYYTYDGAGKLISLNYNGSEYFYVRNIQGDITKIVDDTGKIVVEYTYDAWGNILATDDTSGKDLAKLNPYRYRGYRYDEETSLYYLNSRYYNSGWGRFINADGLIGQTGDILGHNMFAYCQNNPVMMVDPSGYVGFWVKTGISIGVGLLVGGAAAPLVAPLITSLVTGAIEGAATQVICNAIDGKNLGDDVLLEAGIGLVSAGVGYGIGRAVSKIGDPAKILQKLATKADKLESGSGRVAGTLKHTQLEKIIDKAGLRNVSTEASYLNGKAVKFGTKGSVRLDVVKYNSKGQIIGVWDFKTGKAGLTSSRISQIQSHLPNITPIYELRP